jgi:hypothetical protein
VQKFYWKDPYARLVADETGSRRFRYKVVPLAGKPGSLKPMTMLSLVPDEWQSRYFDSQGNSRWRS